MRFPLRQLSLTSVVRSALKRMNGEDVIPRVAGTVPSAKVGVAAKLTVDDAGVPRFHKWQPRAMGAPPMRGAGRVAPRKNAWVDSPCTVCRHGGQGRAKKIPRRLPPRDNERHHPRAQSRDRC